MRLMGLDLETTGLDIPKSYVTEIGWCLIDTDEKKPLMTEAHILHVPHEVKITEEITDITHITREIVDEFGKEPREIYERFNFLLEHHRVDYVVAHNGNFFDKPMLEANMDKYAVALTKTPWIDTYEDVPFPKHFRYKNLTYLCGEHGFVNPFPHAALFDVMATMKVLSFYDLKEVVRRRETPWITIRAMVSFDDKQLAKDRGYMWEQAGNKKFIKQWVKRVKQDELEALEKEAPFKIAVVG